MVKSKAHALHASAMHVSFSATRRRIERRPTARTARAVRCCARTFVNTDLRAGNVERWRDAMPIFNSMSEIITDDIIVDVSNKLAADGNNVFLKLEALNPCGSIKLKTEKFLVDAVLASGKNKRPRLIESSSGNLGIALASICAERGLSFECVVDKNT